MYTAKSKTVNFISSNSGVSSKTGQEYLTISVVLDDNSRITSFRGDKLFDVCLKMRQGDIIDVDFTGFRTNVYVNKDGENIASVEYTGVTSVKLVDEARVIASGFEGREDLVPNSIVKRTKSNAPVAEFKEEEEDAF